MARYSLAIEFESTAIKVVHLRATGKRWRIMKAAVTPLGDVARFPEGELRTNAMAKLLMESIHPAYKGKNVIVSLSGRASMLRFVQAPPVSTSRLETLMAFEAESQAVGSRGSLAYDFMPLGITSSGGMQFIALSVAQSNTISSLRAICVKAGYTKIKFAPSAIGLSNAFIGSYAAEAKETALIADIGANNITLVLVADGKFVFSRTIAGGGARITSLISDTLGISPSDAEERKIRHASFLNDQQLASATDDDKNLHRAVASGASVIGGAIESTLLFCKSQLGLNDLVVNRLYITGGTSRIPGIADAFAAKLNMPVERFRASEGVLNEFGDDYEDLLASCFGLAAGAAGIGDIWDLRTNSDRQHEVYRKHDFYLWFVVPIAALLLIVAAASVFWYGRVYAGYSEDFSNKIARAKKERVEFDDMRSKLDQFEANNNYLLGLTSGSSYLLESMEFIRAILEKEQNAKRFETLFFERIYFGEENRLKRTDIRTNPYTVRTPKATEAVDKYPPQIYLIGWCRVSKPSIAMDMANEFRALLKEEKLIVDSNVRILEEIHEDNPDKEWLDKPFLVQFEILLKTTK